MPKLKNSNGTFWFFSNFKKLCSFFLFFKLILWSVQILCCLNWLLRFPDLFSGGWMTWKYFLVCLGMFEYFYLCLDLKNPFDITLIWIHGEFSQTTDWFFPAAGPASYILLGQNCLQSYRCRHHHPKLYIIVYMQT